MLHQDKIYAAITASDVDSQRTAQRLLNRLLKEANIEQGEIAAISGTGYGRVALDFGEIPTKIITEISCHVLEFTMNDKCAAGTGRFLEKTAEMLDYTVEEIGEKALTSTKPLQISSQCVVFAESEIISLKARGEKREDIAAGIHYAVARRVKNLVKRLDLEPDLEIIDKLPPHTRDFSRELGGFTCTIKVRMV